MKEGSDSAPPRFLQKAQAHQHASGAHGDGDAGVFV